MTTEARPHTDAIIRITPLELATGWVFGHQASRVTPLRSGDAANATATLGDVINRIRGDQSCFVAFSGGRDSSAVLAVATHAARRVGAPDPVPVTNRFPGDAGAEESTWQEAVVRHLELREWIRRDARQDSDLLGDSAATQLERFGVFWPPTAVVNAALYAEARGGVMLTGEGGDELFDPRRVTALYRLFALPHPSRSRLRGALGALIPPRVKRGRKRSELIDDLVWLQPDAKVTAANAMLEDSPEPLHFFRAVRKALSERAGVIGLHNVGVIADTVGTKLAHPMRDPAFLAALGPVMGRWGFVDRNTFMQQLFGDLLPSSMFERRTKATFNSAFFGEACKQFTSSWDGSGVDVEIVDVERLQSEWNAPEPHGMTFMLLQQAWLANTGLRRGTS